MANRRDLLAGGLAFLAVPATVVQRGQPAAAQTATGFQHILVPWTYTQTVDATYPAGTAVLVDTDVTVTGGGPWGPQFQTLFFGSRGVFQFEGLIRYGVNMSAFGLAPVGYGDFICIANTAGTARTLAGGWGFLSARSYVADGATVTLTGSDVNRGGAAFVDSAVYATVDNGTLNGTTNDFEHVSYLSMPGIAGNTTISRRVGFDVRGVYEGVHPAIPEPGGEHWSGAGTWDPTTPTLNEEIGVRVQPLKLGTRKIGVDVNRFESGGTHIGIRNASTYVAPPVNQNVASATTVLSVGAEVVELTNTSTGPITVSSPLPAGQPGQLVEYINVGARTVSVQHGPSFNTRLAAPMITLGTGDSLRLRYSATLGDWLQVGHTNVL